MDVRKIVAEIDAKIASLQQARTVLLNLDGSTEVAKPRRGRPKGSTNAVKAAVATKTTGAPRKRRLSADGRKRIADAMKARWAERRKETSTKAVKKEAAPKKEAAIKK